MINVLFLKRVFCNNIFWLSVMAALLLLLCSIVYTDDFTGKTYAFVSMFYDETTKEALQSGEISMRLMFLGYDRSYLWMFCPIIVGIPCVLTKRIERFVLFRSSKNKYYMTKYVSNLFLGGSILLVAYLLYLFLWMLLTQNYVWDVFLIRKLLSVFAWGMVSAIPSIVLSEFIENKYLILCIPFVLNYFMHMFMGNIIPYTIWQYISPYNYQILLLHDVKTMLVCVAALLGSVVLCGFIIKLSFERRCDCGQK